jgi:hypothetical protein
MDMIFGTWNVRSMYRSGSLKVVGDGGGTERAGKYTFSYGKRNENIVLGTGFFIHKTNHISS